MTVATPHQPDYPSQSQSGTAYPIFIDGTLAAHAQVAGQFAPHQVPNTAAAPTLASVAGGSLGARTYYVKVTYVTALGEVIPSAEVSLAISANNLLRVSSPTAQAGCTGWNVYVSTSAGTQTKQNGGTPIAIGTSWTEPTTGLVSGAALPAGLSKMAIMLAPGRVRNGTTIVDKVAQITSALSAPAANPRKDLVVVDAKTGVVSVVAGTEAASPAVPACPADKVSICSVTLQTSTTQITNSMIEDLRYVWSAQGSFKVDRFTFERTVRAARRAHSSLFL